jgi:hypothetical protein
MYRAMYLIPKQAYLAYKQSNKQNPLQYNQTEVNGGDVHIFTNPKCNDYEDDNTLTNKVLENKNRPYYYNNEVDNNDSYKAVENKEISKSGGMEQKSRNLEKHPLLTTDNNDKKSEEPFIPDLNIAKQSGDMIQPSINNDVHARIPITKPQQVFYPSPSSVSIPSQPLAKSVETLIPSMDNIKGGEEGKEMLLLAKSLFKESRDMMDEFLNNTTQELRDYQEIASRNKETINNFINDMDPNILITSLLDRIKPMLHDNYSEVQRCLTVQETIINNQIQLQSNLNRDERISFQTSMRQDLALMESNFYNNIQTIFQPIQNQLNNDFRAIADASNNAWENRMIDFKNDISQMNNNQLQILHQSIGNEIGLWRQNLSADLAMYLQYEKDTWNQKMKELTNDRSENAKKQIQDMRTSLLQAITNASADFNRKEMLEYDAKFKQLDVYIKQSRELVSQQQSLVHQSQKALPAPSNSQLALPAPSTDGNAQLALPAPTTDNNAQLALPAPNNNGQLALPAPTNPLPALPSIPGPSTQFPMKLMKDMMKDIKKEIEDEPRPVLRKALLPPPPSSTTGNAGSTASTAEPRNTEQEKRVDKLVALKNKPTKDDIENMKAKVTKINKNEAAALAKERVKERLRSNKDYKSYTKYDKKRNILE